MKLQKIKDVRVGQIQTFNEGDTYDVVIDVRNIDRHLQDCLYEVNFIIYCDDKYLSEKTKEQDKDRLYFFDAEFCRQGEKINKDLLKKFKEPDKYLIGFLGITHKIEDGRLIEIKRDKFELDDIISIKKNINGAESFNKSHFNVKKGEIMLVNFCNETTLNCVNSNGYEHNFDFYDDEDENIEDYFEKVGTLGVNYEFINNKMKEYARNNNKN